VLAGAHLAFFLALALAGAQLAWQVSTLEPDDADNCLVRFKSNRFVGVLLALGVAVDVLLGGRAAG
jgi:4-hydroxybenzoate polyprenyltransferase